MTFFTASIEGAIWKKGYVLSPFIGLRDEGNVFQEMLPVSHRDGGVFA
jgi:hypothetical protein